MFFGNFVDEGDNPVNNQSIYNVEGDNPWQLEVYWNSVFFQSGSIIVFSIPEIILLSSAKQNIQVINILE